MKPAATISIVVVAVLTTVVIEEIRIKQLRAEVLRLSQLPTDQPVTITPEDIIAKETPLPGMPPVSPEDPTAFGESENDAPFTETTEETPASLAPLPGMRNVPEAYPPPSDEKIKEVALGPYSDLHYEFGLTNRERVYFDDLLGQRQTKQQELALAWVAADEAGRLQIEKDMLLQIDESDEAIKAFLDKEADYKTFVSYHAMQPERLMLGQLIPLMDEKGVALELAAEQNLVATMYEARLAAGGIDWNSADALKAVVEGDAKERFEKEWSACNEHLQESLPKFLDEKSIEVIMASRGQIKEAILESLESAIEAVNGPAETAEGE